MRLKVAQSNGNGNGLLVEGFSPRLGSPPLTTIARLPPMVHEPAPQRQLSLPQTSALIIGTVIGSGVFISLPIVAALAGSPGMSVLIWLLGGLIWIPQILVLAEMGTSHPVQGGPYTYLQKAGSPFLAFLYTWTAFLTSDTPTLTIIALSAISVLEFFTPLVNDPLLAKLAAAALILAFAALHYRSVRLGGAVQVVLTAAKLTPLLSIVIIGLVALNAEVFSLQIADPLVRERGTLAILIAGISSTLWSYAGFINILYMAGEVKDPGRSLPRALIGSLILIIAAYTLIAMCTSAIVPYADLVGAKGSFVNPFAYLPALSSYAGAIFAVAAFVSMLGVLNATVMAQPRLEYAIARDGLFFPVFGHLHPRFLTPHYSILIQCSLAIVLLLPGSIEDLLGYFTFSYALQNALVYGSYFFLRRKPGYSPTYRAPLGGAMAGTSVLVQVALAIGTVLAYPAGGVLSALVLILTGFPIYHYYRRRMHGPSAMTTEN
jgi:fructoselysine transporter